MNSLKNEDMVCFQTGQLFCKKEEKNLINCKTFRERTQENMYGELQLKSDRLEVLLINRTCHELTVKIFFFKTSFEKCY